MLQAVFIDSVRKCNRQDYEQKFKSINIYIVRAVFNKRDSESKLLLNSRESQRCAILSEARA